MINTTRMYIGKNNKTNVKMDDLCRLCCSNSFVNNSIFDEENALYLKMSLYLPIKVFKNDRLPQKVCDKCSCKVNDFYQFCNETIEVQNRLRSCLLSSGAITDDVVDLTLIKESASPSPPSSVREQATQTGDTTEYNATGDAYNVPVKLEPTAPVKEEAIWNNTYDDHCDTFSDNSDNISLITLKKKKRSKKSESNGVAKKRKKRTKVTEIDKLLDGLTEGATEVKQENVDLKESELDVKDVKKELGLETFNCCVCTLQCYSKNDMLQHYRSHESDAGLPTEPPEAPPPPDGDPLRCLRCRKAVSAGEWAAHWRRHWERDRRPYRCALCEKSFRDPHQILKHGLTHKYGDGGEGGEGGGEPLNKRFICDLCPESFVYMRYLQAHRARAHPEAAARALLLRCAVCARTFAHLNSLRRHLRAHSGARDHLCNVCGKALSSREHLKFHIRIHTGYKPNVCKTCGKGFVKKCNLTLHERVHSGEKPHVCASCGKAFSQRSTLVIHERYHSGARPYACPLCQRAFVAKGLLSMHLKTTCI